MAISAEVGAIAGMIGAIVAILSYNRARSETISMDFPFTMLLEPGVGDSNPGEFRSPTFPSDASKIRLVELKFHVEGAAPDEVYLCVVSDLDDVQRLIDISNQPTDSDDKEIIYFDEKDVAGFVYLTHHFLDDMKQHPNFTVEVWDDENNEYDITMDLNTDMVDDFYYIFVNEGDTLVKVEGYLTTEIMRTPLSKIANKYL